MTEQKPGFVAQIKSFPAVFWVANTMEIFERMAWYGFFAVSSLYITGPVETGGLGFTSEERGQLQAIVPFFLYLLPVITGALADRYGYKKLFIIAYSCMIVFYYALGQFKTFPTFLGAFMLVAVAAAIFKPVVVGTVARVTNESNSSTGFGIFYMMVNVGGFAGPLIAGVIRGISWNYVFISCSVWAAVNLVIVMLFYKDPSTEARSSEQRTLGKVARDMVEVLGNLRFGLTVFVVLIALMVANQEWEHFGFWPHCTIFIVVWLAGNFIWDRMMPVGSGNPKSAASQGRPFFLKRMHCSNWRFALFLLIMSGFWTSFNQIFLTMPPYIRDFVDTRPMVDAGRVVFDWVGKPDWIEGLAAIEETELLGAFDAIVRRAKGVDSMVPEEAPTEEANTKAKEAVLGRLRKLNRDEKITDQERATVEEMLASLQPAQTTDADRAEVERAEELCDAVERAKRVRRLPGDPSLTADDLERLAALVSQLNAPDTQSPLEVVDLVDGARTFLQYKVRVRPTEIGELMTRIPAGVNDVPEEDLETAVETMNKRLDSKGIPEFEDAEAEPLKAELRSLLLQHGPLVPPEAVAAACERLSTEERELEPAILALGVRDLAYRPVIWERMDAGRQVNPEHIVNMDALSIVFLQVFISFLMAKFHRFTSMIVGMLIAAVGIGLSALAGGTMLGPLGGLLMVVIAGIVVFAVGEMMSSPTSQEYVGRIAPRDKVALYMGYYFVSVALGNLFGGILSGQLYGKLARDMQRPDLMWYVFGAIMFATAIVFVLYNIFALPRAAAHTLTDES